MADIVISEFMDEAALADLARDWSLLYEPDLVDRPAELLSAVAECRALIVRNRTQVREDILAAAPQLEVIGRLGVGLDTIDLEACRARGITVCPATGANDLSVAEYVIAAILQLLRGAYQARAAMESGAWPRQALIGREVAGKCLGLIGFGAIARQVAQRAAALGMTVAACDPYVAADDTAWDLAERLKLAELLASSDVLSLHVPLTPETRHLLTAKTFAALPRGAVVINAARGGVLDEAALCNALRSGHLGGAALDVFEHEPLSAEDGARFKGLPNLLLTPHVAGVTVESNERVSWATVANVRRVLEANR